MEEAGGEDEGGDEVGGITELEDMLVILFCCEVSGTR